MQTFLPIKFVPPPSNSFVLVSNPSISVEPPSSPRVCNERHSKAERCVRPAILIVLTVVAGKSTASLTSWRLLTLPLTRAAPPGRSGLAGAVAPSVRQPSPIFPVGAASHGSTCVTSQVSPAATEPSLPVVAALASALGDLDLTQRPGSVGASFRSRGWGLGWVMVLGQGLSPPGGLCGTKGPKMQT